MAKDVGHQYGTIFPINLNPKSRPRGALDSKEWGPKITLINYARYGITINFNRTFIHKKQYQIIATFYLSQR